MAEPGSDRREQRAWYVYDWANSAFQTTVLTVFLGPYLTALAEAAAVDGFVRPLGIPVRVAAYYPYLVSLSALLQVVTMPLVGALVDRTGQRRLLLGLLGYLGGGLLLAANLVLLQQAQAGRLGVDVATAVRISIVSAGGWWALFTLVPLTGLRDVAPRVPAAGGPFAQFATTLRRLRRAPATLTFLAAYLLYGAEAEYFSAYEISDRGTSWIGALLFGLAVQVSGSYRIAILSLVVFFAPGFVLLWRADIRVAAAEAGNAAPARV
ncbi:MAG: MFS transporter [Actinobacteria bacterium]|nr:MFS transporter [Actinomycetota bacterium]